VSSNHTRPTTFDQHLCSGASRCTASLVAFLAAVCRFRGEIGYLAAASGPGMSRAAVFYGPNRHRDGSWGGATSRPRSARVPGSVLAISAGQMPFLGAGDFGDTFWHVESHGRVTDFFDAYREATVPEPRRPE
jgi:hypothetical protein